jgi:hypothetical protein
MKVKNVAVTVAVCAALMGSQGVLAEEQPFQAEGMDFAFDDAKVVSVQMSELSGTEMEETEGAEWVSPAYNGLGALGGGVSGGYAAGSGYVDGGGTSPSGFIGAVVGGAVEGAIGGGVSPISIPANTAINYAGGYAAGSYSSSGHGSSYSSGGR